EAEPTANTHSAGRKLQTAIAGRRCGPARRVRGWLGDPQNEVGRQVFFRIIFSNSSPSLRDKSPPSIKFSHMRRIFPAILSLCMLSLAMSTASAQIRKIPAAVTEAFEARYPDAQQVEWRDKLSAFTASFELKSVAYQASFNSGGEWLQTEHEVDADDLPDPVQDGFEKSRFADWNLERADLIELPDD